MMRLFLLLCLLSSPLAAQTRDLWAERSTPKAGRIVADEITVKRINVLAEDGQEAITIIPQTDTTYGYLRWVNRAGAFMFGLVAHESKVIKGIRYLDNHFSMYRGTDGKKGKTGFFDAEFWGARDGRRDMLTIEGTSFNAERSDVYLRSPNGRTFRLQVSDSGVVSATSASLPDDSVRQ